jgi:catalase (peroxidase I)
MLNAATATILLQLLPNYCTNTRTSTTTVTAIKTMNGPTIPWSAGRVDEMDPSAVTPDGRLPNADVGPKGADKTDASHLRDIFYRMGMSYVLHTHS